MCFWNYWTCGIQYCTTYTAEEMQLHAVLSPHLSPAMSCQKGYSQSHKKAVPCTGEVEYSLGHDKPHTEEEVGGRNEGNH